MGGRAIDTYDSEIEQLRDLTPAKVLRSRYVLAQRIEAPGSTSGLVAERCKLGLATSGPYQGGGGDLQRAELTWLMGLCRDLTPAEERACAIKHGSTGVPVGYERVKRFEDIKEGDGEEIISLHPKDLDGKPCGEGWVRVRGVSERRLTYAEVAAAMAREGWRNADDLPMSAGAVKRLLEQASSKVATAIRARLALAMLEAGAPG